MSAITIQETTSPVAGLRLRTGPRTSVVVPWDQVRHVAAQLNTGAADRAQRQGDRDARRRANRRRKAQRMAAAARAESTRYSTSSAGVATDG